MGTGLSRQPGYAGRQASSPSFICSRQQARPVHGFGTPTRTSPPWHRLRLPSGPSLHAAKIIRFCKSFLLHSILLPKFSLKSVLPLRNVSSHASMAADGSGHSLPGTPVLQLQFIGVRAMNVLQHAAQPIGSSRFLRSGHHLYRSVEETVDHADKNIHAEKMKMKQGIRWACCRRLAQSTDQPAASSPFNLLLFLYMRWSARP